ncbi:hypothetical protein [Streptomyces sp. NPDC048527]|uniref:hypothetical protein n=1 Tax=Streptomyces sp. NPDC048527 TaxID=3365568 RepID=UPI003712767B
MDSDSHAPTLRKASPTDSPAVADVWLRSYGAALPTVRRAHSDDGVREYIERVVVPRGTTWVAEVEGVVVGGFVAVERTDGAGNEEREPDVRYVWRGQPLAAPARPSAY